MRAQWRLTAALACVLSTVPALAQSAAPGTVAATRSGRDIYAQFRAGLADPHCEGNDSRRWRAHFAAAPVRLIARDNEVLPLFGYVVDALRAASLPTEYALIPFVESGYKPGARSAGGPAGLWQMIATTARSHAVPMRAGYDGRLSPVDSTRAAVRYLKTLHGMFAGDWRLAVMAYNAGEYRVFGALRRSGQEARNADPEKLTSLSGISRSYVRKLHALSCLFNAADDDAEWMRALDRQVPILEAVPLPVGASTLGKWAASHGLDAATLLRLNPALSNGRNPPGPWRPQILVPIQGGPTQASAADASAAK